MTVKEDPISLIDIYHILLEYFGDRNWWDAESEFEIIIGSILVQNTNWNNAGKCIQALKENKLLEPEKLINLPQGELAELIRPSGFFNQKTIKIRSFLEFFYREYDFSIDRMKDQHPYTLKEELLDIFGIGEETADCILLYALDKPLFVVDNYTKRIFSRLGLVDPMIKYAELSSYFGKNLPEDIGVYKGYHKLIIYHGREFCSASNPACGICILREYCSYARLTV